MTARVRIESRNRAAYRALIRVADAARAAAEDAGLERRLVELVNVRVSQLNRCAACLDVHVRDALDAGETVQRLAVLPAWRDTTLFSAKERAALALAESVTTLPDRSDSDRSDPEARAELTAAEFAAVSWIVIAINAFNRVSIVSGHDVRAEEPPSTSDRS